MSGRDSSSESMINNKDSARRSRGRRVEIAIIADDLTGANDSGVQLARHGLSTSVIFDIPSSLEEKLEAKDAKSHLTDLEDTIFHEEIVHHKTIGTFNAIDALVIDTDSRALSEEEAYRQVQRATQYIQSLDASIIYKKIDSTLRGNIAAELLAMQEVLQPELFIIVPGYPKNGRTTKAGYHYVHGELLHSTEFSRDPQTPVQESHLPTLLGRQLPVSHIPLPDLHQGYEEVNHKLQEAIATDHRYVIFDAQQEQDLQLIVQYIQRTGYGVVWVGSAGLAQYIPEAYDLIYNTDNSSSMKSLSHRKRPILTVVGSISQVSRKQLDYLLQYREQQNRKMKIGKLHNDNQETRKQPYEHEHSPYPAKGISFHTPAVLDQQMCTKEIIRAAGEVKQAGQAGYHTALYATATFEQIEQLKQDAKQLQLTPAQLTKRIMEALAQVVAQAFQHTDDVDNMDDVDDQKRKQTSIFSGLIMTGGDTAKQISLGLGASGYLVYDEIETGVPLVQMIGATDLFAVTKAGAFGTEEVFVKAIDRILQM